MSPPRRRVGDWSAEVAAHAAAEFAAVHPAPFLVQERSSPVGEESAEMQFATLDAGSAAVATEGLLGSASLADLEALQVGKADGSGFNGMVNLGRAENCDLVLNAASVSKFHAFFKQDPVSGVPQLVDGGSTNGTAVNGQRLEAHEPRDLLPRDLVAFGADSVWRFHSPQTFHELVSLAT